MNERPRRPVQVGLVDYGVGNIGSLASALFRIGVSAAVVGDADAIDAAERLVLPGVGAFDRAMSRLEAGGLRDALERAVAADVPVLGICLGAQLMSLGSEEGTRPGLGWIEGRCVRLESPSTATRVRVPHIGWARVVPTRTHPLFAGLANPRFYFAHAYHVQCVASQVVATSRHGGDFVAAFARGRIFGVQFHPERSHADGERLLASFCNLQSPRARPG